MILSTSSASTPCSRSCARMLSLSALNVSAKLNEYPPTLGRKGASAGQRRIPGDKAFFMPLSFATVKTAEKRAVDRLLEHAKVDESDKIKYAKCVEACTNVTFHNQKGLSLAKLSGSDCGRACPALGGLFIGGSCWRD